MVNNDSVDNLGIPDDQLADLDRETQELTVRTEDRRYGKQMVIIDGFGDSVGLESIASELKSALGTGGTVKGAISSSKAFTRTASESC